MESDQMNGQWREVEVQAPYVAGYAWAGLLIVHAYDNDFGGCVADQFEVWHHASVEFMLEITARLERAQEIATDLANVADWSGLSTTDEMMLQARLMAFGAGYPGEVAVYNDWSAAAELDRIVPYGR
jgi:hypothetical protein